MNFVCVDEPSSKTSVVYFNNIVLTGYSHVMYTDRILVLIKRLQICLYFGGQGNGPLSSSSLGSLDEFLGCNTVTLE